MHPFINSPFQTAVAAVMAMGLAQALQLPDGYWAPISAIVCSLDATDIAYKTARRRLVGTFLGVLIAALQISFVPYNLFTYGIAIALLGFLCSALRLHSSSLRFGGIALTVVVAATDRLSVWMVAGTRFVDVALGVIVALLVVRCWPKHQSLTER